MSERPEPDKASTTQAAPPKQDTPPKKDEPRPTTAEKPGTGKPTDYKKPPDDKEPKEKKGPSGHDVYPDGYTMYLSEDGTWTLVDKDGLVGQWDKAAEVWVDPETGVVRPTGWSNGHESHLAIHTEVSQPPAD